MRTFASLFALNWNPQLRGYMAVIVGAGILCGSVYLILGTNLGARLGLLVSIAGLTGWMVLMGIIWAAYGIGRTGAPPSWKAKDIIVGTDKLIESRYKVAQDPSIATLTVEAGRQNGWIRLADDSGARGQAVAAADEILQFDAEILKAGDYLPQAVYDYGGERWPNIEIKDVEIAGREFGNWNFDYIAFFHKKHYAIVQVKPVIKQSAEPGRAAPKPVVDPSAPDYFVLMERDRGSKRRPAFLMTLGSAILFGWSVMAMNRRERDLMANKAAAG